LGFLSDLFAAAASVGRAIIGVLAPVASVIVQSAKTLINLAVTQGQAWMRNKPTSAREQIERDLHEVNDELMGLQLRGRNGYLSSQQERRLSELRDRRDFLNDEISGIDQVLSAKEMVEDEPAYKPVTITDATAHILQYHVGQSTHNKLCRRCGCVMLLQWNRNTATAGLNDFFWGCSDFYNQTGDREYCDNTERLTPNDLNLFAKLDRPEFGINSEKLTRETVNPTKAQRIRQALDSIKDSQRRNNLGLLTYRCPSHGESLRLRRKNQPEDHLFDEYFLGCPMWLPNKQGCNFIVKLKSAAQISSVLNSEKESGVLNI
jgi:hypothetical protein